jgi:rubrerythrin
MHVVGFQTEDLLDLAINMEIHGADFYDLAAKSASESKTGRMLNGLAAMEREHRDLFKTLKERLSTGMSSVDPEVDEAVTGFLESWLNGQVFNRDEADVSRIAKSGSFGDIIEIAIQMEKDSITFYTGLRHYIADEETEKLLDKIIKEELGHLTALRSALMEQSE